MPGVEVPESRVEAGSGSLDGSETIQVLDVGDLPFRIGLPDALVAPTRIALSVHRLAAFRDADRARNPNLLREPLQTVAELLHVPGRFAITVRLGVRGTERAPRMESDLVIVGAGGEDVVAEVSAARRQVEQHVGGPHAPFVLHRAELGDLAWPTSGHGAFVRQPLLHLDDDGHDVPLRFSFPGPDAPYRLLNSLLAAGPGTDLFVTVSPTTLWRVEQAALEAARLAVADASKSAAVFRDAATAQDAWLSYRTGLYALQLLLVTPEPPTEVMLRSVASAFTAPYDAERHHGSRVVARAERFLGGGFDIELCRDTHEVLTWMGYGLPWIGFRPERELVDLVTSTEVGFTLAWLADPGGQLPGLSSAAAPAPVVQPGPGTVRLGRDPYGRDVRVADRDRHLHTVLVGATGCGKTSLMVDLALQDAEAGRTVVVIDPHGDMTARIASQLPAASRERTYCVDAAAGDLDCLNLLRLFPAGSTRQEVVNFSLVDGMIADLSRDFAGPIFHRIMRRLLEGASLAGGTILDVEDFLAAPRRLASVAKAAKRRDLAELALEMDGWSDSHRAEMTTYVAGKLEWLASPGLRASFATGASSFDLPAVLARGAVVLVNPASDQRSCEVAMSTFLGALLCCLDDRRGHEPTVALYLDEVQRYCGQVVRRLSNELRKRAVALHAASQSLSNLGPHLDALIGNAGNLLIGRCSGPTAAYVESAFGDTASAMIRLPNFRALARLTVGGEPAPTFELCIDPPTGRRGAELPGWLIDQARGRRQAAREQDPVGLKD